MAKESNYQKCFSFFLWVWKFCWISVLILTSKQETTCHILTEIKKKSSHSKIFFSFTSISLILQIHQIWKSFEFCVKLGQVCPKKIWWSHASILLWRSCISSLVYLHCSMMHTLLFLACSVRQRHRCVKVNFFCF